MGQPFSAVIRLAKSSDRSNTRASSAAIRSARSAAGMSTQAPWVSADRAASTARSMSPSTASGAVPTISSVAGFTTVNVLDDAGSTHSPPM